MRPAKTAVELAKTDAGLAWILRTIAEEAGRRGAAPGTLVDLGESTLREFAQNLDAIAGRKLRGNESRPELERAMREALTEALDKFFSTPNRMAAISGSN